MTTTVEKIEVAAATMANAREQYESAVNAMGQLELERRKLTGPDWDTNRVVNLAKQTLPIVTAIVGGGGLAALLADPGAFKSLLTGIFGG